MPKTTGLPSLHQIKEKLSNDERNIVEEKTETFHLRDSDFTFEDLQTHWGEFKQIKKEKGRNLEYIVLNQPFSLDNLAITLSITHPLQDETLNNFRSELMVFLRGKLQNDKINIKTVLVQDIGNTRPYTPREKFTFLAEKNPAILALQQRLGLDTEY